MRTTIELPEDLLRRAKAKAAMQGISLKELFVKGLRLVLDADPSDTKGRVEFPLVRSKNPGVLTLEMVKAAEEEDLRLEAEEFGRSR